MFVFLRNTFCLLLLFVNGSIFADSIFHSLVTDLSPPYFCKLKLNAATGVSLDTKHTYNFSGICSVKLPYGNTWIYQNVWVEVSGNWDSETHTALETAQIVAGDQNRGSVISALRCDDDPWLTKAQCSLDSLQNNTNFSNFGKVFHPRNGLYPPFEISTGQYPPLARNQAIVQDAVDLSIQDARRKANTAHAAFDQTFGKSAVVYQQVPAVTPETKFHPKKHHRRRRCCYREHGYPLNGCGCRRRFDSLPEAPAL